MRKLLFLPLLALIPVWAIAQFDFGNTPTKLGTIDFLGNYSVGRVSPGERLDAAYVIVDSLEGRAYLGLPNLSTRPTCSSSEGNGRMIYDTDDNQAFICSNDNWVRLDFGTTDVSNVDLSGYVTTTALTNANYITDPNARTAIADSLAVVRLPYLSRPACNTASRGRIVLDQDDGNPYACNGSNWLRLDTDANTYATRTWVNGRGFTTASAAIAAARLAIADSNSVLKAPKIQTPGTCNATNEARLYYDTDNGRTYSCSDRSGSFQWEPFGIDFDGDGFHLDIDADDNDNTVFARNLTAANVKAGTEIGPSGDVILTGTLRYEVTNTYNGTDAQIASEYSAANNDRYIYGIGGDDVIRANVWAGCVTKGDLEPSSWTTATGTITGRVRLSTGGVTVADIGSLVDGGEVAIFGGFSATTYISGFTCVGIRGT